MLGKTHKTHRTETQQDFEHKCASEKANEQNNFCFG